MIYRAPAGWILFRIHRVAICCRRLVKLMLTAGSFWNARGSLCKNITPAFLSLEVDVAKPKLVIERLTILCSLRPQQSSYHCRIAPNTHFLVAILLALIDHPPTARFLQQISFCVGFAKTCY